MDILRSPQGLPPGTCHVEGKLFKMHPPDLKTSAACIVDLLLSLKAIKTAEDGDLVFRAPTNSQTLS